MANTVDYDNLPSQWGWFNEQLAYVANQVPKFSNLQTAYQYYGLNGDGTGTIAKTGNTGISNWLKQNQMIVFGIVGTVALLALTKK